MSYKRSRDAYEDDFKPPPYVFYGTPLPPLDPEVRDDGSFVPIWKQEARDEHGRKRFHGAFTGGFSAGYFNTVGSKEGWTPSTFVSSRANKAKDGATKGREQRPEDFMDEEDLAAQEEDRTIQTKNAFSGLGSTGEDSLYKGSLMDLLRSNGETIGVKLLRRMGWKDGQGLGRRVRRAARDDSAAGAGDGQTHLFAPENPKLLSFTRKTDFKGLGYAGEAHSLRKEDVRDDEEEDDVVLKKPARATLLLEAKPKKPQKRTGIGIGVLNDDGSDDDDPYSMGPRISYNRTIGGDKKKPKSKPASTANPLLKSKPVFVSKKLAGFRKCHDGRLPLEGFVLASSPLTVAPSQTWKSPEIPQGWKPAKASTDSVQTASSTYLSTADAAKASTLDPAKRAALLGEEQLKGKSVFDYLSAAARDRLAKVSGKSNLPPGLGEAAPKGYTLNPADQRRDLWSLVPTLDKETALAALGRGIGGWMPYAEDEAKRARYRAFLELRGEIRKDLPPRAEGTTIEDWAKELQEFAHAARVFKPVSGLMASRFTSASTGPKPASDAPERAADEGEKGKATGKEEDPALTAARMGMFGPMTRREERFFPTRLLCKRFGVKSPAHILVDPRDAEGSARGSSKDDVPDLVSKSAMERMLGEVNTGRVARGEERIEQREVVRVDVERNEALEGERAGEELFRAVFGDDSGEE